VAVCEHTAGTRHFRQTSHSSQRLPHPLANLSIHGNKQLSHDTSSRTHTLTDLAFNLRKAPKLEDARNTGQRSHAAILFRSVATQSSIRDPAACSAAQQMRYTRSGQLPSHGRCIYLRREDDAVRNDATRSIRHPLGVKLILMTRRRDFILVQDHALW
jgi:hypothetical protein